MTLDIIPHKTIGREIIQSYGDYRFRINDKVHDYPILVFPNTTIPWPVKTIEDLNLSSISVVKRQQPLPELLLIGCGEKMAFISLDIRDEFKKLGTIIESMDTGAACRTFNVLVAEDRQIAVALIPVE